MNRRNYLLIGLIVLVSSALSFFTLTRGHLWWDDFASYLMQAGSILSWTMTDFIRHNSFTIQNSSYPPGPVAYPWGFPLLLAPVYAIFGLNALAFKLVNLIFYAFFLLIFFFLARSRLKETDAVLICAVLAFMPALIAAQDLILSDIPFMAMSTLGLLLIDRFASGKITTGIATGAVMFGAYFLRSNGILLFVPLVIVIGNIFLQSRRDGLKKAAAPIFTFAVLFGIQTALFPGGQESYFTHFSMFSARGLLDNVLYYLWLPAWTFENIPAGLLLYPLLAVFLLVSLQKNLRRDLAMHAYGLATFGLFIIWPERQGLRFIYPVLPFLFISAFEGMQLAVLHLREHWQKHANLAARSFWMLILVTGLYVSAGSAYSNISAGRAINGPFDPYSDEMFSFIREKTTANSVIIFMRPRVLRLFTGHDSFMTENCEDLVKGDYVAIHDKMAGNGQIPPEQVTSCNLTISLVRVFNNKRFTVYKINR